MHTHKMSKIVTFQIRKYKIWLIELFCVNFKLNYFLLSTIDFVIFNVIYRYNSYF